MFELGRENIHVIMRTWSSIPGDIPPREYAGAEKGDEGTA
jgi:hypothetical protein